MYLKNNNADITTKEIKREFTYENTVMLTLLITYPQIKLTNNFRAQNRINADIRSNVFGFFGYVASTLYFQAIREYKNAIENNFPFRTFDAVLNYDVTFNEDCYLSTYMDRYEFTGGAHGNTIRSSNTWSLKTGQKIPLPHFFKQDKNYEKLLLEQILKQAGMNMQQTPGIYFEDYRSLIVKYFNPQSYYLTLSGIAIYYQQYEIAPYSTGIVVFTIPYKILKLYPSCDHTS